MRGKPLITLVRDAKEELCYVRAKGETAEAPMVKMALVGSQNGLELQDEAWLCPEILFEPSIVGMQAPPAHIAVLSAILAASEDPDVLRQLCRNVCLTGGSARFPGMAQRLQEEMAATLHGKEADICRDPDAAPIVVEVSPPLDDSYGPYHGGVRFASLECFADHACKPPEDHIRGEHEWNHLDQRWAPSEEAADLLDLPGSFQNFLATQESDPSDEASQEDEEDEGDGEDEASASEDGGEAEAAPPSPVRPGSALAALEEQATANEEDQE